MIYENYEGQIEYMYSQGLPPYLGLVTMMQERARFSGIPSLRSPEGIKAHVINKLKDEDYQHRGFLKPIEITLKTHKTEEKSKEGVKTKDKMKSEMMGGPKTFNREDANKLQAGSLPAGLKIAVKKSITNNKFTLEDVEPIHEQDSYESVKAFNKDNMLSLMKRKPGIDLAICVCMYSEDKKMLRSTLKGIQENISNLTCYEGISPDKIGVFVMMDGIEKVEDTVVDFFEQMERSNNIQLGSNIAPTLSIEEMARRARTMTADQINEMELQNANNFLFDAEELKDRNQRRFYEVRREYLEVKALLGKIDMMEKEKPHFDDLPSKLRDIFIELARIQYMLDLNLRPEDEEVKGLSNQKLINLFANDLTKARPLIIKTLQQGKRYCKEYIQSREDLAYLVAYRQKVKHDPKKFEDYEEIDRTQMVLRQTLLQEGQDERSFTVMNLFLCVKYRNSGKLSSHNWFFNGFCKELRPSYAILLDVGLRPADDAIWKMYKYMTKNERRTGQISGGVGGVCGYMSLKIERVEEHEQVRQEHIDCLSRLLLYFVDIQRTQQVEYHLSHLIDKPFQSIFGFIHVLPGAFSGYNMKAIINYDQQDDKLLKEYFKSIEDKLEDNRVIQTSLTIPEILTRTLFPDALANSCLTVDPESDQQMLYNQNIYFAEDRILCMGIHKKGYTMTYLPQAYAEVDPIKNLYGLLGQRKRWINGSFFAFEKVKKELQEHKRQTKEKEFWLQVQITYLTLLNSMAYLSPALFAFTIHVAMQSLRTNFLIHVFGSIAGDDPDAPVYKAFVYTMDWMYTMFFLTMVFLSMHLSNNSTRYKPYLYAISTLFGIFGVMVIVVLTVDVVKGLVDNDSFMSQNSSEIPGGIAAIDTMRWMLIGSILIYIVPILIYLILFGKCHILFEIIFGGFSFLFYAPTYLNILNIYSLCRIDDISWGTKGLDSSGGGKNKELKDSWRLIKMIHVAKYVFWNVVVGVILLSLGARLNQKSDDDGESNDDGSKGLTVTGVSFLVTFAIVIMIASSIAIKVVVAIAYLFKYKWNNFKCCPVEPEVYLNQQSRINRLFKRFQPQILREIEINIDRRADEYVRDRINRAVVMAERNSVPVEQPVQENRGRQKSFDNNANDFSSNIRISHRSALGRSLLGRSISHPDIGLDEDIRRTNKDNNNY